MVEGRQGPPLNRFARTSRRTESASCRLRHRSLDRVTAVTLRFLLEHEGTRVEEGECMSHFVENLLGFGSYEGEAVIDSGRRRIVIGALWVSLPFIVASSLSGFAKGVPLVAIVVGIQAVLHLGGLMFLKL